MKTCKMNTRRLPRNVLEVSPHQPYHFISCSGARQAQTRELKYIEIIGSYIYSALCHLMGMAQNYEGQTRTISRPNMAKVVSLLPLFWASLLHETNFWCMVFHNWQDLVHSFQPFRFSARCFHYGTYLLQAHVSTGSRSAKVATWRPEWSRLHAGGP